MYSPWISIAAAKLLGSKSVLCCRFMPFMGMKQLHSHDLLQEKLAAVQVISGTW